MRKLACSLAALLVSFSLTAHADDALSLERQGDDAAAEHRWEDATAAYEAAYLVSHRVELLARLATAYEASQRYPQALDRVAMLAAARADASLEARLESLKARVAVVSVDTSVCDAEVKIRSIVVGKTCTGVFKVNAGPARIEVSKIGHADFATTVDLAGGRTTPVAVPLAPKNESVLVVRASVPGARVAVDGEEAGTVPTEIVVRPGSHAVVVSQDGYETRQVSALVGLGQRSDVDLHLEEKKTVAERWWFWTAVGVGLATAVTATVFLVGGSGNDDSSGTIAPGRVSAPLRF